MAIRTPALGGLIPATCAKALLSWALLLDGAGAAAPLLLLRAAEGGLHASKVECRQQLAQEEENALRTVLEAINPPVHGWEDGDLCDVTGVACSEVEPCRLTVTKLYFRPAGPLVLPAELAQLPNLAELDLHGSQVAGSLSPLAKLQALRVVRLPGTQVQGELDTLTELANLTCLDLSGTRVSGRLADISGLWSLKELLLPGTSVTGTVSELERMPSLTVVDLSGTGVTLTPVAADAPEVEPGPDSADAPHFAALTRLDLSGCSLNVNVTDLFQTLYWAGRLSQLRAARCGLGGILPDLAALPGPRPTPLLSSLVVLELDGNAIEEARLPTPTLHSLSLAGSPLLGSIAPELLQSRTLRLNLRDSAAFGEHLFKEPFSWKRNQQELVFPTDAGGSYRCFTIADRPWLLVSPEVFAPKALCDCLQGFEGSAAACTRCHPARVKAHVGDGVCIPCPWLHRAAPDGSRCHLHPAVEFSIILWPAAAFLCLGTGCLACIASARRSGRLDSLVAAWHEPILEAIPAKVPDDSLGSQEVVFYFVDASFVRGLGDREGAVPRFQELLCKKFVRPFTMTLGDLFAGKYRDEFVAVSHRWAGPEHPDPTGEQQRAVRDFLRSHPSVKWVWFDYWCTPQVFRTQRQTDFFGYTLRQVLYLYLTVQVVILLDDQYVGRFWTLAEAWLAMRTASRLGLKPAADEQRRFEICAVGAAAEDPETHIEALLSMWQECGLREAMATLAEHDIHAANLQDKALQLKKLRSLPRSIRCIFHGPPPRAPAPEAPPPVLPRMRSSIRSCTGTAGDADVAALRQAQRLRSRGQSGTSGDVELAPMRGGLMQGRSSGVSQLRSRGNTGTAGDGELLAMQGGPMQASLSNLSYPKLGSQSATAGDFEASVALGGLTQIREGECMAASGSEGQEATSTEYAGNFPVRVQGPPPPPGDHWAHYTDTEDEERVWWFYDGPLGKWWCDDGEQPMPFNPEGSVADLLVVGPRSTSW